MTKIAKKTYYKNKHCKYNIKNWWRKKETNDDIKVSIKISNGVKIYTTLNILKNMNLKDNNNIYYVLRMLMEKMVILRRIILLIK